jgi:hypothetical protein
LRSAFQTASQRLGRGDPAPTANGNASPHTAAPQRAVQTVRQPPAEPPSSSRPQVSQALPNSGATSGRFLPSRDDQHYLPSIRLRHGHGTRKPNVAVHDYAASPGGADKSASGTQGNLLTRARQLLGFRHGEEDSQQSEGDYDAVMVDALDALGTCPTTIFTFKICVLTDTARPRSSNVGIPDQCSELTLRPRPRQIRE